MLEATSSAERGASVVSDAVAAMERIETSANRISEIVAGVSWDPAYRSPLAEPGVSVREGDYVICQRRNTARNGETVVALLEDGVRRPTRPHNLPIPAPLHLHADYQLAEIMAAMGVVDAIAFLREINQGGRQRPGRRVAVVGGVLPGPSDPRWIS